MKNKNNSLVRTRGSATEKSYIGGKYYLRGFYLLLAISLLSFFSCEAQIKTLPTDPDGCDTVYVESPLFQKCADDLYQATADILAKTAHIKTLNGVIVNNNTTISNKNDEIEALEVALAKKPDTIYETIHDSIILDYIIVNNIRYKVSEIELILPKQTIDTVSINTCFEDFEEKQWFHVGEVNIYPHRIYFPTKELEIIGVMFTDSLTTDMKKYQNKFKIERTVDHSTGTTKYKNLYVAPSEYLPSN